MAKPVVVLLDPHGPEVRSAIQAECPAEVLLRVTTSCDPAERHALVEDAEFFVGGITPIPASLICAAPRLRLIHKWGIGVDKIDLAAARERSVPVAITAGANAAPVAEFTLLLVLAVLGRLPHREAQLRAGEWPRAREETRAQARQLRGKLVALVGLGAIGREVARRMRAFDAEVRYFDVRRLPPAPAGARPRVLTPMRGADSLAGGCLMALGVLSLAEEGSKDPAFLEQALKLSKVVACKGPDAFRQFQEEELKKYLPLAIEMGIRK